MKSGLLGMFQTNNRLGGEGCEKVNSVKGTKPRLPLASIHTKKIIKNIIVFKSKQLDALNYIKLKLKYTNSIKC